MKIDELICGNNVEVLNKFRDECIDLTVTSPPYDLIRKYKGAVMDTGHNGYSFPFEPLADQLYRVTKQGGVVVWVVNDGTDKDGSETGNSFRQALYFKSLGFNIHDTMFYEKNGPNHPDTNRYYQTVEYMFVLSKGKPKTIRLINDRANKWVGNWGTKTIRDGEDKLKAQKKYENSFHGVRFHLWRYFTGKGYSTKDEIAFEHPAIFPEELARDHILSWSNVGDVVLDPFIGSGTTAKMAMIHRRHYIGIDINREYVDLTRRRLALHSNDLDLDTEYSDEAFIESIKEEAKIKEIKKQSEEDLDAENTLSELF